MKTVTGKLTSSAPATLGIATSIVSRFAASDTCASQAINAYLRRASSACAELFRLHLKYDRQNEDNPISVQASGKTDFCLNRESEKEKKFIHDEPETPANLITCETLLNAGDRKSKDERKRSNSRVNETIHVSDGLGEEFDQLTRITEHDKFVGQYVNTRKFNDKQGEEVGHGRYKSEEDLCKGKNKKQRKEEIVNGEVRDGGVGFGKHKDQVKFKHETLEDGKVGYQRMGNGVAITDMKKKKKKKRRNQMNELEDKNYLVCDTNGRGSINSGDFGVGITRENMDRDDGEFREGMKKTNGGIKMERQETISVNWNKSMEHGGRESVLGMKVKEETISNSQNPVKFEKLNFTDIDNVDFQKETMGIKEHKKWKRKWRTSEAKEGAGFSDDRQHKRKKMGEHTS